MSNDERTGDELHGDELHGEAAGQWEETAHESFGALEEAIRAASSYVIPSDELRPRTLEAARELCDDRQGSVRLGRFAAVLLLGLVVSVPLAERMASWYERVASPSSAELQERALEIASDRSIGPHWGLFEAYSQLRRSQAVRLGGAAVPNSMQ